MDTAKILSNVAENYQGCVSYTDTGKLSSNAGNLEFKTYFCRPHKFRFEWSKSSADRSHERIIFSESNLKAIYFDGETFEETDSLALAIAGATGVSMGAAPLIAHLLMPNLFKFSQYQTLSSMAPYSLTVEDEFSFEIRADWRANCWTTLVIDKIKPIIRRIEIGTTPTMEEKKKGIDALELLQAPEASEVSALLLMQEKTHKCRILYSHVSFDKSISPELFSKV